MTAPTVSRDDVLEFRFRRHQLDRPAGTTVDPADLDLLDYGVQDTGPDGALWALAIRGMSPTASTDLAFAWTLRGAPHAYLRSALDAVAVATAPLSEADAASRIYDASKPLREAGIPIIDALRTIAGHERSIATRPTVKGELSTRLTQAVDQPFLRECQPCKTVHTYEMPFRLAALQAGLELEAGTSPPVLRQAPGLNPLLYSKIGAEAEPRFDVIRNYLRFFGPASPRDAAGFFDAPVKDVKANWPADAREVVVTSASPAAPNQTRFVLEQDLDVISGAAENSGDRLVRLLGPYDPYLQLRDRETLVDDKARRKDLWPTLGRPGAILARGEVIGTWRPRTAGRKLTIRVRRWPLFEQHDLSAVEDQAERLAAHRDVALAGIVEE